MRLQHSAEVVKNLICQGEVLEFCLVGSAVTGCLKKGRAMLRFVFQMITWAVVWVRPQVGRTGSLVSLSLVNRG